jgi:hypothetical protein
VRNNIPAKGLVPYADKILQSTLPVKPEARSRRVQFRTWTHESEHIVIALNGPQSDFQRVKRPIIGDTIAMKIQG